MALSEWSVALKLLPEALALLAVGGDRAEEPFALLGAPEDVLERLGDGAEVRQEVAAAGEELFEPGARGRRNLAADDHLGLAGLAALELDVLVAQQSARLDRRARALADHRRPALDDVVDDAHGAVGRVAREPDLDDAADDDAVQRDVVARDQARCRVEVRLVRELAAKEVGSLPDHEDPDHRRDERDEDHDPHPETPPDLLFGHRHTPFGAVSKTPVPQGKPMARKYSMRTGCVLDAASSNVPMNWKSPW